MPTLSGRPTDQTAAVDLPDIEPVVLTSGPAPFDDPDWLFEPKYDGLRAMIYSSPQGCRINLAGEILFERCAELEERVARVLGGREAIIDGLVVALNSRGKPGMRELLRGLGYLAFAASDLLWLDGQDLRGLPLIERKRLLCELLPEDTGPLYKILTLEEHGRALFVAVQKLDLGGIVAKRKSDSYGPAAAWYQIPNSAYSGGGTAGKRGSGARPELSEGKEQRESWDVRETRRRG
jgi:bifunctional non-homologous end joining protein LigD